MVELMFYIIVIPLFFLFWVFMGEEFLMWHFIFISLIIAIGIICYSLGKDTGTKSCYCREILRKNVK